MVEVLLLLLRGLFSGFQSHSGLMLENVAPRHQLALLKRQARKPKLRPADRLLWVSLRRIWSHWRQALLLFQPQTVIAWHRLGFRYSGVGNLELVAADPPPTETSSR